MRDMFKHRSAEVEIMDDLSCSGTVVNKSLAELDTINKWLGGNRVTINGVEKLLANKKIPDVITIADLGCGSGEMLKLINEWAQRIKHSVSLTGFDANDSVTAYARSHLKDLHNAELITMDILSEEFKFQKFDIVVATLFFHHFTSEQLVDFFKQLRHQVRIGIVINDIHRHWLAYYSIQLLTRLFSRSPMVIHDAPLSVLRAFSKNELVDILKKADVANFSIQWCWAFRWQVVIKV